MIKQLPKGYFKEEHPFIEKDCYQLIYLNKLIQELAISRSVLIGIDYSEAECCFVKDYYYKYINERNWVPKFRIKFIDYGKFWWLRKIS